MRSLAILLALILAVPAAHAVPFQLTHQGKLVDSAGSPRTASHALVVTLYGIQSPAPIRLPPQSG